MVYDTPFCSFYRLVVKVEIGGTQPLLVENKEVVVCMKYVTTIKYIQIMINRQLFLEESLKPRQCART
jgi:hypothetical protein